MKVHVVHELREISRPEDGDQAVVVVPSDHRDGGIARVERWSRVASQWLLDAVDEARAA